jgi:hypothetical protein
MIQFAILLNAAIAQIPISSLKQRKKGEWYA